MDNKQRAVSNAVELMISFKTSKEVFRKLRKIDSAENIALLKLFAEFGFKDFKISTARTVRAKAFEKGDLEGTNKTFKLLAIWYPCSKCGKGMMVLGNSQKKAIQEWIISQKWHHDGDCKQYTK